MGLRKKNEPQKQNQYSTPSLTCSISSSAIGSVGPFTSFSKPPGLVRSPLTAAVIADVPLFSLGRHHLTFTPTEYRLAFPESRVNLRTFTMLIGLPWN